MPSGTIFLLIFTVTLIGVLPIWPHSRAWGNRPVCWLGLVVIILLVLVLLDQIRTGGESIIHFDRNFKLDSPILLSGTMPTIPAIEMKVTSLEVFRWRCV